MNKPTVKIKLLPGGKMPKRMSKGAAAWDCFAREDVLVGEEPRIIGLGFMAEPPDGYYLKILPRSSIGLKTKLRMANSVGIIDSDFRGEVNFIGEAKNGGVWIGNGQRIAQMIIKKNEDVEFVQVDELSETVQAVLVAQESKKEYPQCIVLKSTSQIACRGCAG